MTMAPLFAASRASCPDQYRSSPASVGFLADQPGSLVCHGGGAVHHQGRDGRSDAVLPHAALPARVYDQPGDRLRGRASAGQLLHAAEGEAVGGSSADGLPARGADFPVATMCAQKPSELLAEMLRLCPRGQENSLFFTYLFLHHLPRELQVLLTDVDHNDRRLLSERADQLWAHYAKHSHSTMACIEGASLDEDSGAVAAFRRQGPGSKAHLRKGGIAPVGGPAPAIRQQQQQRPQRQQSSDGWLCWYHHTSGDQANACRQPCAWSLEN
jgi:hypothetical protein